MRLQTHEEMADFLSAGTDWPNAVVLARIAAMGLPMRTAEGRWEYNGQYWVFIAEGR